MKKQSYNKSELAKDLKVYAVVGTLAVGMMFVSPLLNKGINASTLATFNNAPKYAEQTIKAQGKEAVRDNEHYLEQATINKIYDSIQKGEFTSKSVVDLQHANYDFSQTAQSSQPGMTWGSDEMQGINTQEILEKFAKPAKIFDPAGSRALAEGNVNGYSAAELKTDPGVFCIELDRPLSGHADPSRGVNGPSDPNVESFTARLSEYAARLEQYKKERVNLLAEIQYENRNKEKLDENTEKEVKELDEGLKELEEAVRKFKEEYPAKIKQLEEAQMKYTAGSMDQATWNKHQEEFNKYKEELKALEEKLFKNNLNRPKTNTRNTVRNTASSLTSGTSSNSSTTGRINTNGIVNTVSNAMSNLQNSVFNSNPELQDAMNRSSEWGAVAGNVASNRRSESVTNRGNITIPEGQGTIRQSGGRYFATDRNAALQAIRNNNQNSNQTNRTGSTSSFGTGNGSPDSGNGVVESDVKSQLQKVVNFSKDNIDEADIAYIVTAYQELGKGSSYPEESGGSAFGRLQGTVWRSHISSPASQQSKGGDEALLAESKDYKAYWAKLLEYENSHGNFPDDGYQTFLKGKGYHADVKIKNSEGGRKQGEETIMINPKVNYVPRILPGDGSTMEQSSKVNFDTQTQKWLIGPYKLDYLSEGTPQGGDGNFNKIFAGMTNMKLFGVYDQGQNGRQAEATEIASIPGQEQAGITEEDLDKYAKDPDKFQTADIEKAEGLSEVKKWRLKKAGGNESIIPKPNQEFFFEIDYDPALQYVAKARFEFAYMIHSGVRKQYKLFIGKLQNFDIQTLVSDNAVASEATVPYISGYRNEDITDREGNVVGQRQVPNWSYGYEIRPQADVTSNVQFDENVEQQQTLISVEALRWLEHVAVELRFKDNDSGDYKLKLRLPIGGKVWEDKNENKYKHNGYDNILGTQSDELLPNVKVTILRNFVKLDGNKRTTEVLKKEYARVYDINSGALIDQNNLYTNTNGEYGPFDIHDIGFTQDELGKSGKDFKGYGVVFEVRFDYDGMQYEPVIPMQTANTGVEATKSENAVSGNISKAVAEFNTVAPEEKAKYAVSSFAFENTDTRDRFNNANATMGGKEAATPEGNTTGVTLAAKDTKNAPAHGNRLINYTKAGDIKAANADQEYQITRFQSQYKVEMPGEVGGVDVNKHMSASTLEIGVKLPANEKIRFDVESKDIQGAFDEIAGKYYKSKEYMKQINLGLKRRKPVNLGLVKSLNNAIVTVNKKAYNYVYSDLYTEMRTIEEANDGMGTAISLKGRDEKKKDQLLDLYKTDYIYRTAMYNQDKDLKNRLDEEVKEEQAKDKQNTGHEDTRALDVFITYRINVMNDSPVDTVQVNAIDDYFNNKMELVNTEVKKVIEKDPSEAPKAIEENKGTDNPNGINLAREDLEIGLPKYKVRAKGDTTIPKEIAQIGKDNVFGLNVEGFDSTKHAGTYKSGLQYQDFMDGIRVEGKDSQIQLNPNESADIYLTFRVKNATSVFDVKNRNAESLGALNKHLGTNITVLSDALNLGEFENVAEVARFTTYNTLNGKTSGKFDETSAPDNVDLRNIKAGAMFEDDTDGAPTIQLRIPNEPEEQVRKLQGKLWEDRRDTDNKGIITGDGVFNGNEKGIKNMPLTLEERVSVRKSSDIVKNLVEDGNGNVERASVQYVDVPFVWPNSVNYVDSKNKGIALDLKAVTGFDSTVTTGENGDYTFTGIPAGNMAVVMDYTSPNADARRKLLTLPENQGKEAVKAIEKYADLKESDLIKTADSELRDVKYYNGLDFKNTMFYTNNGKADSETDNVYKTWLDKGDKTAHNSYLRDDELRRVQITNDFDKVKNSNVDLADTFKGEAAMKSVNNADPSLKYETKLAKAHQLTTLRSTTPKMNFSIEHYERLKKAKNSKSTIMNEYKDLYAVEGNYASTSDSKVKDMGYNVENIDLGIVERPKSKLVLNKEITQITLTTANGQKPIDIYYNVDAEVSNKTNENYKLDQVPYGKSREAEKVVNFKRTIDTAKSTGVDYVMSLDRSDFPDGTEKNALDKDKVQIKNGFRYINVDQSLLQDSTISVKYGIYAFNLGEVDRKIDVAKAVENGLIDKTTGLNNVNEFYRQRELAYRTGLDLGQATLNSQSEEGFKYGTYAGLEYYTLLSESVATSEQKKTPEANKLEDKDVSNITVTNIIDLADNNAEVNLNDPANSSWQAGDKRDVVGLIQNVTEESVNPGANANIKADIVDSNGVSYVKDLGKVTNGQSNKSLTGVPAITENTVNTEIVSIPTNNVVTPTVVPVKSEDANIKSNLMLLKESAVSIKPYELVKGKTGGENKTTFVDQEAGQESLGKVAGRDYINKWTIKIDRTVSSQTDKKDLAFENIAEIAEYHTENGRRTYDTPGNVVPQIDKNSGNGGGIVPGNNDVNATPKVPNSPMSVDEIKVRAVALENDSALTEDVTLSPPTGLSSVKEAKMLAVMGAISAIGISAGVITYVDKKKFFNNKFWSKK